MKSIEDIPSPCFDFADIYDEAVALFPDGHFVEIGCYLGRSTVYLCRKIAEFQANGKITLDIVDNFSCKPDQYKLFAQNLIEFKVARYIRNIYQKTSAEASWKYKKDSLDFVFVDGGHKYETIRSDLRLWYPKVKQGGIFAGHDYTDEEHSSDVRVAVDMFADEWDFEIEERGSSWLIRK